MVASLVSVLLSDEKNKSISPVEERLISILKDGGPLTRAQLVKKFPERRSGEPFARTTIYDGLKKLINRGEVKKFPFYKTEQVRGRPQVLWALLSDKK